MMKPENVPLTAEDIALLRVSKQAGMVYLVMQHLGRASGAREIAALLGIDEHTAARHLRRLEELKLVERQRRKQGYRVRDNAQMFQDTAEAGGLREEIHSPEPREGLLNSHENGQNEQNPEPDGDRGDQTAQNYQDGEGNDSSHTVQNTQQRRKKRRNGAKWRHASTTDSDIDLNINLRDSVVVDDGTKFTANGEEKPLALRGPRKMTSGSLTAGDCRASLAVTPQKPCGTSRQNASTSQDNSSTEHPGVWMELYAAGIGRNARTQALVLQPHMTREYVKAHRLKLEATGKGGARWAGLLVTILESGEPAPEMNPNGHLGDCNCLECHGYRVARSWEEY